MRIGGLASGMDIDGLVEKLMVAERAPLDKLEQKKQTYEWQRDAYRDVNNKLTTFDTYIADNFILKSLNTKTATTSNSDWVEAKATGAASGTISIEGVTQLATASRKVGSMVNTKIGTIASGSTKISELANSTFTDTDKEYSILLKSIGAGGTIATEATEIKFKATDTIDQVISKINASTAGVVAFFESGKLSITAKNTGKLQGEGGEIQLVESQKLKDGTTITQTGNELFKQLGMGDSNNLVEGGTVGTNAMLRVNGIDIERSSNNFTLNGYSITLKDTFNSKETLQNQINSLNELITTTQDVITDLEKEIDEVLKPAEITKKSLYDDEVLQFFGANINTLSAEAKSVIGKMTTEQIQALVEVADLADDEWQIEGLDEADANVLKSLSPDEKTLIEGSSFDTLRKINAYENLDATSKVLISSLNSDELLNELAGIDDLSDEAAIGNSGLNLEQKQILLSSTFSSKQKEIISSLSVDDLKGIRDVVNSKNTYDASVEAITAAENQIIKSNKDIALYTQQKNEAQIKKDNISVDETAGKTVTLNSTTNVDEIIDKIKEFVKTYNGLITDLKNLTTETKYRDFKPLTTLQRKEMEESEIKLWEEKAKSGLLRNDSIITSGLSSMRSLIYQSNPAVANTKYNTLYNIGITTSKDFMSGGTLEINEGKLREALEADPESVVKLLTFGGEKAETGETGATVTATGEKVNTLGFMRKIRLEMDVIEKKIDERAGRGSMNETQFTLGKYLRDINKRIEDWQVKLVSIEDRYWKQFGVMETMINRANNQSAMLMNQFY